jgi:hypothetical protein
VNDEAIVKHAQNSNIKADSKAISGLISRWLSPEKALDLMAPPRLH